MQSELTITSVSSGLSPEMLFIGNQVCISTRKTYANELQLFKMTLPKRMQDVTFSDLLWYRAKLEARGLKSATVVKKLRAITAWFKFLNEHRLIATNPSAGLKLPKVQNETTKDILSLCESNRLIASIDTSTIRGKRDKAIMALFLINGLRVCEIVRANVGDLVQREECWVLRVHGKGNKEADTRIREDTYRVIHEYLEARGSVPSHEPLFIGTNHRAGQRLTTRAVQYMVKDRLYAIGVRRENVTCHSLRHSAISHLIRAGASLLDTQEFARHSSPSTTFRYIHNEDKIKKHAVLLNPITIQE